MNTETPKWIAETIRKAHKLTGSEESTLELLESEAFWIGAWKEATSASPSH